MCTALSPMSYCTFPRSQDRSTDLLVRISSKPNDSIAGTTYFSCITSAWVMLMCILPRTCLASCSTVFSCMKTHCVALADGLAGCLSKQSPFISLCILAFLMRAFLVPVRTQPLIRSMPYGLHNLWAGIARLVGLSTIVEPQLKLKSALRT